MTVPGGTKADAASDQQPTVWKTDGSWVEKKVDEKCWVWRSLDLSQPRDPAEIPANRPEHLRRLQTGLWGPKWARLCAVSVVEDRGALVAVRDHKAKQIYEVPVSQLLPWYEGLLVLDAISRSPMTSLPWFQELSGILLQDRKERRLSSTLYVEKRLLDAAVTGPTTCDSTGACWQHRRRPLRKELLPSGEADPDAGWYTVDGLLKYLPPWEALVTPKCGLYQEFYLVQWAPPHNIIDYSAMEHGSETQRGATWEPDECVPDGLDVLRVKAKLQWLEQEQRNRQIREKEEALKQAKVKRSGQEAGVEEETRPTKQMRNFNPAALDKLWKDLFSPNISHGISQGPSSSQETEIKLGWPKKPEDYPRGHSVSQPPGCCTDCNCMEDWHLGDVPDPGKAYLANHNRDRTVERVPDSLSYAGLVRRRGTVTGRHYFEPSGGYTRLGPSSDLQAALSKASEDLQRALELVSQNLPMQALREQRGASIMPSLGFWSGQVIAVSQYEEHAGAHGPYIPSQYRLAKGTPNWLSLKASNGEFIINNDEMPALMPKKVAGITVNLVEPDDQKAFQTIKCTIDSQTQAHGSGALEGPTREVLKALQAVPAPQRGLVEARLAPIYDFAARHVKQVHVGTWVKTVSDAALMLSCASTSHVMLAPGAA